MSQEETSVTVPPQQLNSSPGLLSSGSKVVLILVGLVASGKSTFAKALEEHFPQFRRCNQDDLGNRREVEKLARRSLEDGLSVCIDRSNFDENQRATWINIAHEFPGTLVWMLVFDTPFETCVERLASRKDHPTIHSPEEGLKVLKRFEVQFQPPSPREGYTRILSLKPSEHPHEHYSAADVRAIVQRLQESPEVTPPSDTVGGGSRVAGPHQRGGRYRREFSSRSRGSPSRGFMSSVHRGGGRGGYPGSSQNTNGRARSSSGRLWVRF